MYRIKYETWKKTCTLVREYSIKYGKFYFQLYPIKYCNNYNIITTKEFFQNNILNGRFLTEETNYNICENYEIKKDGTFRNKVLISPILYIYYTVLVMEISQKYKQKRNDDISVRYAGNYAKEELHYKNQYYEFISELQELSNKYDTYLKLDIKDFFEKIDINKMAVLLKNSISINEKEQMQFKELISFIGNKKFPQIDAGIASSYLATIVYLDIIDNRYYRQIKNILKTEDFKMIRYVDDLYIFFNSGDLQLNKIENRLTYEYTNLLHEYSLNVNMDKTYIRDSSLIYEDINSISLEDEAVLEEELSNDFTKNALESFLGELINETKNNGINYKTYYNIIDEYFDNPNIRFYQRQIYNTIVFKNLEWFKETNTYESFKDILSNNNDILIHDPKRLLSALLNMHSPELIKRFLYNLYVKYENYEWTIYDSFLAMRYLLYRNFKNKKLLKILEQKDSKLYMYISQYIENNWTENIINTNISEMEIFDEALMESIFFIRFLSIIELNKENYLTYQAYMKSFFDSVTSNLVNIKENKKEYFFEKRRILQFYKKNFNIDGNNEQQISCFCDSRNENPLCHSNIKIIKNKNMKEKIIKESKDIVEMLNKIL